MNAIGPEPARPRSPAATAAAAIRELAGARYQARVIAETAKKLHG